MKYFLMVIAGVAVSLCGLLLLDWLNVEGWSNVIAFIALAVVVRFAIYYFWKRTE